jgi:hypothetical protein
VTEAKAAEVFLLERRGIHVEARTRQAVPALEELIAQLMPGLGLNWLIAEVNYGFDYATHPEVSDPDPLTADDARRLARLAREHGIRLVPMFNCVGHQSWGERLGGLLRAHPEFDEAPDLDATAEDFYCASWCPNHPEVNPLVFDLFDELLDAFEADAFHAGMDEIFVIGRCDRCKRTAPAQLLARAVNDYHEHLVGRRGVEMQIWGDRLLPRSLGFSHWDSSENHTEGAAGLIPKDIVICDWHYHFMADFPSVAYFVERGFRVWPAGWREEDAVRRLIEVARSAGGPNMLGYLATTWCGSQNMADGLSGRKAEFEPDWVPEVASCVKLAAALSQA